ncbi:MAG TPA: hypothetical protein VNQ80_03015 [Parapedobacter sp.]|uniref:hypothetical protein n=1 Tax=Parapedobacter sp. TaxID=1958893 RepID=UPI002D179232|nr:hypothetical protein [Parapedobacter sp.]HWK56281.1 hypothetical protein [Parapedobacter sp.]
MDKRPRKELIDGLRDSLRNFEERYDRSEWEHFQRQRNKRRRKPIPLFVKLAGIAASLFLMVYASVRILPLLDFTDDAGKHIPSEVTSPQKEPEQENPDSLVVDSIAKSIEEEQTQETASVSIAQKTYSSSFVGQIEGEEIGSPGKNKHPKVIEHVELNTPLARSVTNERLVRTWSLPTTPFVSGVDRKEKGFYRWYRKSRGPSGLDVGANITPVFTDKGISLGGGVSVQLPLSNRLSTEVGVGYMGLRIGKNFEANKTDTVSLQTVGVRNAIGMVAIPISLNYAFTESFSGSLGLVPFRVVRDQRTDILQRYRWVSGGVLSGDTTGRLIGERTRMKRADSLYMGNTYLGFIQVSGRYTPSLLKKRNVVISPFIAVPVGRLQDDEYRWLNGGVSIRFYLQ